jgi:hypothetical protein
MIILRILWRAARITFVFVALLPAFIMGLVIILILITLSQ